MPTIYVIEELWTDPMENDFNAALGYKAIGYVVGIDRANQLVQEAGFNDHRGWPILGRKIPKRKMIKLEELIKEA